MKENQRIQIDEYLLFLHKEQGTYKRYSLKSEIYMGRDSHNEIVIQKENISKRHAKISFDKAWYVEDLNSTNGVFLNQKRIKKAVLKFGDCISLVGYDIYFCEFFLLVCTATNVHLNSFQPIYDYPKKMNKKELCLITKVTKPELKLPKTSSNFLSYALYPLLMLYFQKQTYIVWISLATLAFRLASDLFIRVKLFFCYQQENRLYQKYLESRFLPINTLTKKYFLSEFSSYKIRIGKRKKKIIIHDFKLYPRVLLVGNEEEVKILLVQIIYQFIVYYPNVYIDLNEWNLQLLFSKLTKKDKTKVLGVNKEGDFRIDTVCQLKELKTKYDSIIHVDEKWYFQKQKKKLCFDSLDYPYIISDKFADDYKVNTIPSFFEVMNLTFELKQLRMSNASVFSLKGLLGYFEGKTMYLDLHEQKQGPHLLVLGMSGSGKSEWLTSYLLSLAILYDSYDVQFFIVDFKGGILCSMFEKLHHTTMVLSNLHQYQIYRCVAALQDEIEYRENLLLEVSEEVHQPIVDVYQLKRVHFQGKTEKNIAHLVIVVDEFAELKMLYPEMMEGLIRIARTGRSLGIHLILCTQRASGIVDRQIESNIQSVVCFKVASKQDSYDVLGNNHAYQLDRAGQLICKCGNEEIYSQTVWLDQQPTIIFNDLNFDEQFRLFYKEQFISNKNTCIEQINEQTTKCPQLYIRYFELEKVPKDMFGIYDYYQKRKIISFSSSQIKWIIGGKIKGYEEKTIEQIYARELMGEQGIIFFDLQILKKMVMTKIQFEINPQKQIGALYLKGEVYQCKVGYPVI